MEKSECTTAQKGTFLLYSNFALPSTEREGEREIEKRNKNKNKKRKQKRNETKIIPTNIKTQSVHDPANQG